MAGQLPRSPHFPQLAPAPSDLASVLSALTLATPFPAALTSRWLPLVVVGSLDRELPQKVQVPNPDTQLLGIGSQLAVWTLERGGSRLRK